MYAAVSDLIRRFSASDLVLLTNERQAEVAPALLEAAAAGEDLSAYTEEEQAAAEACLAAVEEAVEDAQSEIDPQLASAGYDVPLGQDGEGAGTPRALERIASHIAHYNLHERPTESVRRRYEDAVSFLKRVGRGQASLGPAESGAEAPEPEAGVDATGSDPVFSGGRSRYPGASALFFFRGPHGTVGL